MPEPNLIHPVEITLERRDLGNTIYDEDTREPVRQLARKTEVPINAQMLWEMADSPEPNTGGIDLGERGYFLVKTSDMRAASLTIKQGDRVFVPDPITLGATIEVYVTRTRPMAHYPGLGATLLRAYFEDRSPTQSSGTP